MAEPTSGHRQRLRERFLSGDASARTDETLLELLLTFAIPQKDVRPLASELLQRFGSLHGALSAPSDALKEVPGVGDATLVLFKLVAQIAQSAPEYQTREIEAREWPGQMSLFGLGEDIKLAGDDARPQTRHSTTGRRHRGRSSQTESFIPAGKVVRPTQRHRSELFRNAFLKDAIQLLPLLPETDSLAEVRLFLRRHALHYSSEQTRERISNYIVSRMFPAGQADPALRHFARKFAGTEALREVAYYRFMNAEPLMERFALDMLIPNLGQGQLLRSDVRLYLANRYPSASKKFVADCATAIVDVLVAAGVARSDRKQFSFQLREPRLESFAFVLHSQFPEPGMYPIDAIESDPIFKAMMWWPDRLLVALYELRNRGLIAKISEIDNIRQFTTRYDLDGLVQAMVQGGNDR